MLEADQCPTCASQRYTATDQAPQIKRHRSSATDKKRYIGRNIECTGETFYIDYISKRYLPSVKQQIVNLAMNGSGIRDTRRVLGISLTIVINELKKELKKEPSVRNVHLI